MERASVTVPQLSMLNKKELRRPDEFMSIFGNLMQWATERVRGVTTIVFGLIVLGLGAIAWNSWSDTKNRAAADDFREIVETASSNLVSTALKLGSQEKGSDPKPATKAKWEKVASELPPFLEKHGLSSFAGTALLYQGRANLEIGKYDVALKAYQQAESKLNGAYRYLALEGQAMVYMQQEKWNAAEKLWTTLSKADDNPLRALHTWNLGLAQEAAKRNSEAVKTYKDFETRFSDSDLIEKVRLRLAILQATG